MTNYRQSAPIKSHGPRHLRRLAGPTALFMLLGISILGAASCSEPSAPPMTKAQEYPGPWRSVTPTIYRAIYAGGHRCGEGYMRASVKNEGEHLIYCHEQTEVWTTYLVW